MESELFSCAKGSRKLPLSHQWESRSTTTQLELSAVCSKQHQPPCKPFQLLRSVPASAIDVVRLQCPLGYKITTKRSALSCPVYEPDNTQLQHPMQAVHSIIIYYRLFLRSTAGVFPNTRIIIPVKFEYRLFLAPAIHRGFLPIRLLCAIIPRLQGCGDR